jgi:hypothetical protein
LESESDDRLSCKIKCSDNKRYLTSNYKCINDCPSPYIFVVIDGNNPAECLTKCPDTMPYATKNEKGEYVCSDSKCNNFYYSNNNTCTDNCNEGDYVLEIDDLKICTTYCDYYDSKRLYYYEKGTEKKCVFSCKGTEYEYTSIEGKCVNSCNENEYYDENDFVCKFRCPTGKKIDGQICREKCNDISKSLAKFENENGYCVEQLKSSDSQDVAAAAMACIEVQNHGIERFVKSALSFCESTEKSKYLGVVSRGLEEIKILLMEHDIL